MRILILFAAPTALAACNTASLSAPCTTNPDPASIEVSVTPDVACEIYTGDGGIVSGSHTRCQELCGAAYPSCSVPDSYVEAYKQLEPTPQERGYSAQAWCPNLTGNVGLKCEQAECF